MSSLYIDPIGGVAGDMLCAALFDLGIDQQKWQSYIKTLKLDNYAITISKCMRGAFSAHHLKIEPVHTYDAPPSNHHHIQPWGHHHRSFSTICALIDNSELPLKSKTNAKRVFEKIALVEAQIHGCDIQEVHFHEVGATDSIIDIVGFCLGLEMLGIEKLYNAPPPLSYGHTHGAHGTIPLPAPATLSLLQGRAVRAGHPNHEQTTPTGAAIIAALSEDADFPTGILGSIGYGAGTRNPQGYANILRLFVIDRPGDPLYELHTQLDDMTGEAIPILLERCLKTGAKDAFVQSILMKKGRMGYLLTVLVTAKYKADVESAIFKNTTTFGIRCHLVTRTILHRRRELIATPWGPVHIKIGSSEANIEQISVEYEDAAAIARQHQLPLKFIYQQAIKIWSAQS